jgi:pimeloyl-ACP methyl ester carboxylesterase
VTDVRTPDGRTLHVREAGDPAGRPVIVHHGTPSSGLLNPKHARDAAERGIRLIGYDRPGFGGSTPRPGRRVADAAGDVVAIADALRLERFAAWGISGGGPHVLACAALLPERTVAAAAVASVAPYDADGLDWLEGMGEGNIIEHAAILEGGEAFERFLEREAAQFLAATPEQLVDALRLHLSDVDAAELTGELAAFMLAAFADGLRNGIAGWRDDDYAFVAPWGFELESIRVPVLLRQGRQDRMVPFGHGAWLAGQIPGVEAELSEEHGHLTLRRGIPEVHAWLLERF